MLSLKESIKMHNSCSYKLLFEKLEDRNIKRKLNLQKERQLCLQNKKEKIKTK